MIVDSHVHLFFAGSDPMAFFRGCVKMGAATFAKGTGLPGDPDQLLEAGLALLSDPDGDKLVSGMDQAGIDRAVLLPLDFGLGGDEPRVGGSETLAIEAKNELYFQATQRHPGRLFTFLGVDPRRRGALKLFERGLSECGALGLKLHPTTGFYPHDPVCRPFYETALGAGVPVLIHSGNEPAPLKPMFSQPRYIDAVAADYPDLKIIIAHAGHGWWQEALDLASAKPNLYVDFSGWQIEFAGNPDYLYRVLRMAIDLLGPWRVLFGTDGSMTNLVVNPTEWIQAWREPHSPSGITFSAEELDIVLGGAAARLYGWEEGRSTADAG